MRILVSAFTLAVLGVLLTAIGLALTFNPQAMFTANAITLGTDPNLLSEIRAPGGALLIAGVVVFLAAFQAKLRHLAWTLSAVMYGGYGLGRLVSLVADGMPAPSLMIALGIELIAALIALIALRPKRLQPRCTRQVIA